MRILVVVAHPDDEVLGFGAAGWLLAEGGAEIGVCFLSGSVQARQARPSDGELMSHALRAQEILGFGQPWFGHFPNIRMNTVDHLDLVQYVESVITQHRPDAVITHHPYDINDDHRQVARAAMAAARLQQRGNESVPPLQMLLHMEIQSSTDWQYASEGVPFTPDTYFEIGEEGLRRKLHALRAYEGVMRHFPHPRSEEAIRGLAAVRGAESGQNYSEAFVTGFRQWLRLAGGAVVR